MGRKRSFDELYPTNEDYRRFDQRDSAFGQQLRKTGRMIEFGTNEYRADRIKRNVAGFTLVDYAYHDAAGMYENLPWERPGMDRGFYSWSPLGAARKPEGVPRWEVLPEEAARTVARRPGTSVPPAWASASWIAGGCTAARDTGRRSSSRTWRRPT
jgi:hypothetical protein